MVRSWWIRWSVCVLATLGVWAVQPGSAAAEEEVLRLYFWDDVMLERLGEVVDHFAAPPGKAFLRVQVDAAERRRIEALGFHVEVDVAGTEAVRLAQRAARFAPRGGPGIPGFPCYRTVEETFDSAQDLVAAHPTLASWIDVGDSWVKTQNGAAGYDIRVLRLTNSAVGGTKPKLMVLGGIHAREYTTPELVTRFAERLLTGYDTDPEATWLLDHREIHLVLQANPDGRKQAETGLSWRKNANNDFCPNSNDRGIDLNRNFPFQWGCCGGSSGSACSVTFRGPSAGSEPESQAILAHARSIFPDQRPDDLVTPAPDTATGLFIDVHSFGEWILSSWGFTTTAPPNAGQILRMARKMAFYNGHEPRLGSLGSVDGATKDFAYGELGVPGFTFELGGSFFESCGVFESSILEGNLEALTLAAKIADTPYRTPGGPEAVDPTAPAFPVALADPIDLAATFDDGRFSTANGSEPSQTVSQAVVTVDLPPSDPGAVPLAMSADDGTFDETVEAASLQIAGGTLSEGRHLVYFQGRDSDGLWGPISARFVHVIDPFTAPTLEGFVRDAGSGTGIAAEVRIGSFVVDTHPATGFYQLQLPAGTYDLTVSAAGFRGADEPGVVVAGSGTVQRDFDLAPYLPVFADDVEGGNLGWSAGGTWAITTEASSSPTRSWTDSPGGNYPNNTDTSLESPILDLSGVEGVRLSFRHIFNLESGFDYGIVEASASGGGTWDEVARFSGVETATPWGLVEIDLPQLDGAATARIRFRLTSDTSQTRDGWHLDDIELEGVNTNAIFRDGFENGNTSAWSGTNE